MAAMKTHVVTSLQLGKPCFR